jgi:hypothetical protein
LERAKADLARGGAAWTDPPGFDLEVLQTRLQETLAWYVTKAPIAHPQDDLRTEALAPSGDVAHPTKQAWSGFPRPWTDAMHQVYYQAQAQAPQMRQALVDEVAGKRRTLLSGFRLDPLQRPSLFVKGRLLTYEPELNIYDGAAENASRGFFDVDNMPPWDLWLVYVIEQGPQPHTYLLAWVPPECLELATAGIEVNPEQCIRWADDVDAEFVHRLRAAGKLQ